MSEPEVPPTDPAAIATSNLDGAGAQAVADMAEAPIAPNGEISSSTGDATAESDLKDTQMTDVSSDQPQSARIAAQQAQQNPSSNAPSPTPIPPRLSSTTNNPAAAASTPTATTTTNTTNGEGERTSSRAASVNPDAGPSFTMPAEAAPHGAPVRQYINSKITGALLEGMKKVAREQPKDPLRVLGEFLLQKSKELEGTGTTS
ncbi:hypothetical protein V8F20_008387 [Naviculisporaceae sp. PSN 640]